MRRLIPMGITDVRNLQGGRKKFLFYEDNKKRCAAPVRPFCRRYHAEISAMRLKMNDFVFTVFGLYLDYIWHSGFGDEHHIFFVGEHLQQLFSRRHGDIALFDAHSHSIPRGDAFAAWRNALQIRLGRGARWMRSSKKDQLSFNRLWIRVAGLPRNMICPLA